MLKNKIVALFSLLGLFIVFAPLFTGSTAAWGDAPYITHSAFGDYLKEVSAWSNRGNAIGGINSFIWIYPIMYLYAQLGNLGVSNHVILLLLFYLPGIILGYLGVFFLAKSLKIDFFGRIIASTFYVCNSYFLLLVDGGQVGIVLAYGLFPWVVYLLRKLTRITLIKFLLTLGVVIVTTIADPRFTVLAFLTALVWILLEKEKVHSKWRIILNLILLSLAGLILSWYWIWPLFKAGEGTVQNLTEYKFTSLLHAITSFQPHWPGNEFGKVIPPPFYYVGIPILILFLMIRKFNRISALLILIFLFSAFLAKGTNFPFGGMFEYLLNLPFGVVFRDSSKFYTPLILSISLLLGLFSTSYKKTVVSILLLLYVFLLVPEAVVGKLNFNLGNRNYPNELSKISNDLSNENGFFRVMWIPTLHPGAFSSEERPAISGENLVSIRPLARLSAGTYDPFNYFNKEETYEWLDIFGIKYLILGDNPRIKTKDEAETKSLQETRELIATNSAVTHKNKDNKIAVYETRSHKPRVYSVDKILAVVGSENIYEKLKGNIANQGVVFFEDGLFDPQYLDNVATQSATIVFNEKSKNDLTMSFLKKHFKDPQGEGDWAYYSEPDFRLWRYQLQIRGLNVDDMDYGKGVAFSSNPNEVISIKSKANGNPPYLLGIRLTGSKDSIVEISVNDKKIEFRPKKEGLFGWYSIETNNKNNIIKLTNKQGLSVVNAHFVAALTEYQKALSLTDKYLTSFEITDIDNLSSDSSWREVYFKESHPYRFDVTSGEGYWIILNERFNPKWKLYKDTFNYDSIPIYGAITGFYVRPNTQNNLIYFQGQETLRWGIYGSLIGVIFITIIIIWKRTK